jgi:hypothetical protein
MFRTLVDLMQKKPSFPTEVLVIRAYSSTPGQQIPTLAEMKALGAFVRHIRTAHTVNGIIAKKGTRSSQRIKRRGSKRSRIGQVDEASRRVMDPIPEGKDREDAIDLTQSPHVLRSEFGAWGAEGECEGSAGDLSDGPGSLVESSDSDEDEDDLDGLERSTDEEEVCHRSQASRLGGPSRSPPA